MDSLKEKFLPKFVEVGEQKFYEFLLYYAMNKFVLIEKGEYKGILPDLEFLSYYDQFIILYRREGEAVYLEIAKVFRKSAHKIYRIMLKKEMTKRNAKFLNMV